METDEIQCNIGNPFDSKTAVINQIIVLVAFALETYAIARYKARKLPLWIAVLIIYFTVGRRLDCARCRYYGQPCATMLGVWTSRIMPRSESGPLERKDLLKEIAWLLAIASYSCPQIIQSFQLTVTWLAFVLGFVGTHLLGACGKCGNEFCPMKDIRRAIGRS